VRRFLSIAALALVPVFGLGGPSLAEDVNPFDPGLTVGTKAPGFALTDQNGETRSLSSLLGRGKLAVVFYRSADW